jgi:hypothetical protein
MRWRCDSTSVAASTPVACSMATSCRHDRRPTRRRICPRVANKIDSRNCQRALMQLTSSLLDCCSARGEADPHNDVLAITALQRQHVVTHATSMDDAASGLRVPVGDVLRVKHKLAAAQVRRHRKAQVDGPGGGSNEFDEETLGGGRGGTSESRLCGSPGSSAQQRRCIARKTRECD